MAAKSSEAIPDLQLKFDRPTEQFEQAALRHDPRSRR